MPGGRAFLRPPGRKSGEQIAARQGVRWVKVRRLSVGRRRFAHPFGGALAPLGSPPGRLALLNYSGAEFLPRLFFSNGRPQNRGAARGLLPPRKAILSFAHINL